MHNTAKEMAKWAMDKAKACGYENLSAEDWKELLDCTGSALNAICVEKDHKIIEAMKEEEESDKAMQRMGYPRHRDSMGRFTRTYMYPRTYSEDDYMMSYLDNPSEFKHNMRMGYPMYDMGYTDDKNMGGMNNSNGYHHGNNSEYGRSFDQYREARRHYTETQDEHSKQQMKVHEKESFDRIKEMLTTMWSGLETGDKQKYKTELNQYLQQLPIQ